MTAILPTATITTAAAGVLGPQLQMKLGPVGLVAQATFTYGSGGTTCVVYLQTSIDGIAWCDVMIWSFTTSSARTIQTVAPTVTSGTSPIVPTDGAQTAGTAPNPIMGSQWRVKFTSTGTYAGNTRLRVDLLSNALTGQ